MSSNSNNKGTRLSTADFDEPVQKISRVEALKQVTDLNYEVKVANIPDTYFDMVKTGFETLSQLASALAKETNARIEAQYRAESFRNCLQKSNDDNILANQEKKQLGADIQAANLEKKQIQTELEAAKEKIKELENQLKGNGFWLVFHHSLSNS